MYYEEKIIDGVLCYRCTPNGKFKPMSAKQIVDKMKKYQMLIAEKFDQMDKMVVEKNTLLNALHRIQSAYDWEEDFAGKVARETLNAFNYSFNENGSVVSE